MSITFQDIYTSHEVADWMKKSFQGFELDSRKVKPGQIFVP